MNVLAWLSHFASGYPFSAHMVQHLLLAQVVAPLLLLILPCSTARRITKNPSAQVLVKLLRRHSLTWLIGIGAMWVWHVPTFCQVIATHSGLNVVQSFCFLLSGAIFWWPIVSPIQQERMQPVPWSVLYLASGCLGCTVLGILITFAPAGFFEPHAFAHHAGMVSSASDQQIGGLLMWVPGCLIYLSAVMAMLARWYSAPEELSIGPADGSRKAEWA